MTVISVRAVSDGWVLERGDGAAPLVFRRGGEAERRARQLGA